MYVRLTSIYRGSHQVRSSPEAERKAVIFNDKDIPAVEMTPEGLRDDMLLPIILCTAFTECGLVKGHGFPGTGEDTISGHITESFLGAGSRMKKLIRAKREGKAIDTRHAEEHPVSTEGGSDPEAQ